MNIGFHTDAFNSAAFSFKKAVDWARNNDVHGIECGVIEGVSWIHGLGYFPHISLNDDPVLLKEGMAKKGVKFTQIDAAYPLEELEGMTLGVQYILKSLQWAKLAGCPNIATTDGLTAPEGISDEESMELMKRCYGIVVNVAEKYGININIEIHGYFTTRPDCLARMLSFCDSKYFGLNFDTGNTFISGADPVEVCKRFLNRINHVHIKDVSASLAAKSRGSETGIAISHCSIGEGVNAENIVKCLELLKGNGYNGTLSMETEGGGGPLIEKSLEWLRGTMKKLNISEEK